MAKYGMNKDFEPCPTCPTQGECRREGRCRLEAMTEPKRFMAPPKSMRRRDKVRSLMKKQRGSNV